MKLDQYQSGNFDRGRSRLTECLWIVLQAILVSSWIPGSFHRVALLKMFGARIGRGVVIKPGVRIKFPWKLTVGDHSWLGESCWIDNLDEVTIGSHCCLSQGTYLCTGNHDWQAETFDLITRPVVIEDRVWIAACCLVSPGVVIKSGSIITLGSVVVTDTEADTVYSGNPARVVKKRNINPSPLRGEGRGEGE